jgi:putative addiction module component (TIGR02574 family)
VKLRSLCTMFSIYYPSGMANSVEKLTEEILALPIDTRAALADRLVESLDPLTDESVRNAWASEALRRRDEVRSGVATTVSEEDVALYVRGLLRR